jgi:hypothetical protein
MRRCAAAGTLLTVARVSEARQIPVRRSIPDYSFGSRGLRGLEDHAWQANDVHPRDQTGAGERGRYF